jgi:tripartite-type tricarboxylate transporter receptor subunit TctC
MAMKRMFKAALGLMLLAAGLSAPAADAQQYPNRPVRILVGFAAGGGPDVLARTVATQLSLSMGQQFYIDNRVGANGTLALNAMLQTEPDGHTLFFSGSSIVMMPHLMKNLAFDVGRDIVPVAAVGSLDGFLILVHPSTPVHSVTEFIDYAKKNRVLYGTPGFGNTLHIVSEMFRAQAGIKMEHIPYKGAGEVASALLSQTINVMFVTPPSVLAFAKEGKLRAIGYTAPKPFAELPNVQTVPSVVPGYKQSGSWSMFFAPAKTPPHVVSELNAAILKALASPSVVSYMRRSGYGEETRNATEIAAFYRKELDAAQESVKITGIEPQ